MEDGGGRWCQVEVSCQFEEFLFEVRSMVGTQQTCRLRLEPESRVGWVSSGIVVFWNFPILEWIKFGC
jgi:hypothetical protein